MLRPKDAEKFVREFEAEQKAREAAGEVRATHEDIRKLMVPYEEEELSSMEQAYYNELVEMLEWDEKDLPFLSDLEDEELESEAELE